MKKRPKVGDRVEILVAEESFRKGDRGIVENVGTLAVTLIGANLSGRLLIIDPREGT